MHAITRPGTPCLRRPALRSFWPSQGAFHWEPTATGVVIALMPCVSGAVVAAVLNSFDWCYGEVRVTLALCLSSACACATLLVCWSLYPENMRRSVIYAIAAGLGAAVPLFKFG